MKENMRIAIIGAGPAGLTAAYLLAKAGKDAVVFEKDPVYVGGISRTESYKGYHFDIGGHRFFSKAKDVEDLWEEILGDDLLVRPRKSRIYYKQKFFSYPLIAREALQKLGLVESFRCIMSYFSAKLFPKRNPVSFEDWVSNHFGRRLYRIFFKTYTEKVWGVPCSQISADWAAQRIQGLSLSALIRNALQKNGDQPVAKTLIDFFKYPRLGPGMMWERCREKAEKLGARVKMGMEVAGLSYDQQKWRVQTADGSDHGEFDQVISSAPLGELIPHIRPLLPKEVLDAASKLAYRDFITVVLILADKNRFDDNWIYIHDPSVKVGRIQNFKAWSPQMVPDQDMACYGLEYFCFESDGMWKQPDAELIALATEELNMIGITGNEPVADAYVVRQKKAYPVYDHAYHQHVLLIREALRSYPGLQLAGRNGMHKYNNQDHSMMTAMLAVKNILAGKEIYDLWKVNQDAEYIESGTHAEGGRKIPHALESIT